MEEINNNSKSETLNIEIPEELKDNLIKEAKRKNISLSDLICEILENI
tara:strand:+ start:750 stop:893 length:144 start_codon:yes stop_codon:yes gene_type:complete